MMPYIFWSAPVPLPWKHPHNMMLPSACFTVGIVFLNKKPHPFFTIHTAYHCDQPFKIFVSFCQRIKDLQTPVFLSLTRGFFHAWQSFGPWRCRTLLMVDVHIWYLVPLTSFTSSFVVVLARSWTFWSRFVDSWE